MNARDISYSSQGNNKPVIPGSTLSSMWLKEMYGGGLR